ncbi:MAG: hypothetical protein LBU48_01875, partial [Coriobacteriales bacterium]|nr:hypothetical protein [Coriobacteriales bacterium]
TGAAGTAGTAGTAADATASDAAATASDAAANATKEDGAAADAPNNTATPVADAAANAGQPNSTNTPATGADKLPAVEYLPVEEDYQIWAFVNATVKEAELLDQQRLAHAFSLLDTSFTYRYGYPFSSLVPDDEASTPVDETVDKTEGTPPQTGETLPQPTTPETPVIPPNLPLTPFVLTSEDFRLFIYDLPDKTRLIIYLDPAAMRCTGFSLQLP